MTAHELETATTSGSSSGAGNMIDETGDAASGSGSSKEQQQPPQQATGALTPLPAKQDQQGDAAAVEEEEEDAGRTATPATTMATTPGGSDAGADEAAPLAATAAATNGPAAVATVRQLLGGSVASSVTGGSSVGGGDCDEMGEGEEGQGPGGWKVGPEDFAPLCVIGQGAFGRVLQVRSKLDSEVYAMKVISKKMLKKKNHLSYMRAERDIMTKVDFPFVVGLKFSFQTEDKLFLVMNYLPGGELFFHLRKQGLILEDTARFYVAEMVLALEHLHSKGIIHRDLKPENVLLGRDGHLCLTDFGLAKELSPSGGGGGGGEGDGDDEDGRARTVCGTNEYMCPEMILKKGYGKAADWWSLGALMYEMMAGQAPFRAKCAKELNRKILNEKLSLPKWLSSEAHSVLKGLLERNVQKRLGATRSTMFEVGGVAALKGHKFFRPIDWQALVRKQLPAPVVPELAGDADTRNFDEEFTKMDLSLSLVEIEDREATHSDTFTGFSFIEASIPIPAAEPAYRRELRLRQQNQAGGLTASGKKKKKKKPAAAAAAAAASAAAAAATPAALAMRSIAESGEEQQEPQQPQEEEEEQEQEQEQKGGDKQRPSAALPVAPPAQAPTKQAREAFRPVSKGEQPTLSLSSPSAAAAARPVTAEGPLAPTDFPPLVVPAETQQAVAKPAPTTPTKGGAPGMLPEPPTNTTTTDGEQQQQQQQQPKPAPKPFSWSAVVSKAPASPSGVAAAAAKPPSSPSPLSSPTKQPQAQPTPADKHHQHQQQRASEPASAGERKNGSDEEEENEDDGFVVVTAKRGAGVKKAAAPAAKSHDGGASSNKMSASAKAFVPRGAWASRA